MGCRAGDDDGIKSRDGFFQFRTEGVRLGTVAEPPG